MKTRKLGLVLILLTSLIVGSAVALTYWSRSFAKTVTVSATYDVYSNIVDITPAPVYGDLTLTDTLIGGNMIRLAVDRTSSNVGPDAYIRITATGPFITGGGTVTASIRRYEITILDAITQIGPTINVADINTMTPTLIQGISATGGQFPYIEITLAFNTGTLNPGNYDTTITVELGDNGI